MNLPYDSCALWLTIGEFFEETRVGKIARRGDGKRQCNIIMKTEKDGLEEPAGPVAALLSRMFLYVLHAEPATYLAVDLW